MITVTDVRRTGMEIDVQDFVRALQRQARRDLPKGASKAAISSAVATRLVMGPVQLPPGIWLPPSVAVVGITLNFGGVVYHWRCQGCDRLRRYLYRWRKDEPWLCRGCLALRYTSQLWPRLSSLRRVMEGTHELDILAHQRRAHIGHVGRPPTRRLQQLAARGLRWSERLDDAMEDAACLLNLGTGGWE